MISGITNHRRRFPRRRRSPSPASSRDFAPAHCERRRLLRWRGNSTRTSSPVNTRWQTSARVESMFQALWFERKGLGEVFSICSFRARSMVASRFPMKGCIARTCWNFWSFVSAQVIHSMWWTWTGKRLGKAQTPSGWGEKEDIFIENIIRSFRSGWCKKGGNDSCSKWTVLEHPRTISYFFMQHSHFLSRKIFPWFSRAFCLFFRNHLTQVIFDSVSGLFNPMMLNIRSIVSEKEA